MLDEPFAALGPALRDEMLDLVARIRDEQAATLLMVTHAPADARRIADQIVLVEGGRTHPPVATATLLDNPTPALATYLGSG
jgi:thiamine transport system ATP-binding protein